MKAKKTIQRNTITLGLLKKYIKPFKNDTFKLRIDEIFEGRQPSELNIIDSKNNEYNFQQLATWLLEHEYTIISNTASFFQLKLK